MTTAITDEGVLEKIAKGEELSTEEQEYVKGNPELMEKPPAPAAKEEEDPEKIKIPKKEEAQETAEEKSAREAKEKEEAAAKAKAAAEAKPGEVTAERRALIEAELQKPQGSQDLTKFSPTELGLYIDLRKARSKNQKLDEENEILRVQNIVKNLKAKKEDEGEEEEEEPDPLEGKEDGDLLTVGEAKQILVALKAKKLAGKEKQAEVPLIPLERIRLEKVEADARLKSKGITDLFDVVDFAEAALKDDKDAIELLRETARTGGNTVEQTYWLIKGSKAWPAIEKVLQDEKAKANGDKKPPAKVDASESEARAKKLKENEEKVVTTGAGGGGAEAGEFTLDDIRNMTIEDIKKLPRGTRQAILKKYGSNPNLNG